MSQIKFEILGVKLVAIEDKINHQTYLVEMKPINLNIKWGGAGVIIVTRELDFKTSDYLVISPFANAIALVSCITGPSAIGSEKGIPTSMKSTPFDCNTKICSVVLSNVG